EVEHEKFAEASQEAVNELVKYVSVPGFRRGKAPKHLAQRYLNQDVVQQRAVEVLVPRALNEAIEQSGLRLYSVQEIDAGEPPEDQEPFRFSAIISTQPEVKLGQYKGLRIEYTPVQVGEEDVDAMIKRMLEGRQELKTVDRPAEPGDWVVLRSKSAGENAPERVSIADPELGSTGEKLVGVKAGDEVVLPAPQNDKEEDTFVVVEVRSWSAPELTDELARELGDYSSVEDLKASVRRQLEERARDIENQEIEKKLLDEVISRAEVQFPDDMVEEVAAGRTAELTEKLSRSGYSLREYLRRSGKTISSFNEEIKERTAESLRAYLVLRAIADEQGLKSDEDSDSRGGSSEEATEREAQTSKSNRDWISKVIEFLKNNNEIVAVSAGEHGGEA
ncbi:MAG: trigger factor, partial [Armatimonadota bacterium]